MLTLDQVRAQIGGFVLAANFTVPTGACIAILGPSGGGKSTLLSVIAGFLAPQSGRVLWQGEDLAGRDPGMRPCSILFQDNNLFPHLTASQNVALGLRPSLRVSSDEAGRVGDALARVGLNGFEHRKPSALSGGQQGRVALARALVQAKPLMLLDEPFAALGPRLKSEMLDLVMMLAEETAATVMMITHDPDDAKQLGGQSVLVSDGVASPPEETSALLADPPAALRAYLK